MGPFTMEAFLGDGCLRELVPRLVEEGWDDVPTLKSMTAQDMDAFNMSSKQKDALEIRTYLHDRLLMQYGDQLEASGRSLAELLDYKAHMLSSLFGMKRGHAARFLNRNYVCGEKIPSCALSARKKSLSSRANSSDCGSTISDDNQTLTSFSERSRLIGHTVGTTISENYVFKGMVAYARSETRLFGLMKPPRLPDDVAPYSSIQNIQVERLTPEYKINADGLVKIKSSPMKAYELWRDQPAVLLCIRRPGCVMCRAQAYQIYAKKPIFDALGVRLIAVLHEELEHEVNNFWPHYWGGTVLLDRNLGFYKALGGGTTLKEKFLTGFILNPRAIANYFRARDTGLAHNMNGEGLILGGLFVIGRGKTGVAYQFIERNLGDWVPVAEVIEICRRLQDV